MDAQDLIERYVREVGRNLPRRVRADIELELRSLLHDSLDERTAHEDTPPTAAMAAKLLREFGKPDVIAAGYLPEQYLIGPQLYPIFKVVLTIMLVIIAVVHVAGLGFILLRGDATLFGQDAWNWFGSFFRSAVFNAGIITLIFAGVERAQITTGLKPAQAHADWDPLSLPAVKDNNRINRFELGFGMLWTVAFIILFNFYPEWVAVITFSSGEDAQLIRLLAPAFAVHIPWLTLTWTLELVLKSVVLAQGYWTRITRWLELAMVPLNIYILNRIRTGGEIFTIAGVTMAAQLLLGLIMVIVVLDGLYKLVRLVTGRPFSPKEMFKSRPA